MNITSIALADIRLDGGTQSRTSVNESTVSEYVDALLAGAEFPPVVVFFDGTDYYLSDGFHRYHAHQQAGSVHIMADVRNGTRRQAVLFSVGANAIHGLRRSQEDKRKAVRTLLEDDEWGQWSDREIARHCNVDHKTVAKVRADASGDFPRCEPGEQPEARKFERGGKVHEQQAKKRQPETTVATPREVPTSGPVSSVEPAAPSDDDGPDAAQLLDEMQADLRKAEARVAELEKALAEDGKEAVVKLSQRLEHAERRQAELQEDAAKLKQARDFYERQLARCGKAVGQRDLDKVAPAVEAFVRAHAKVAA